jgi:hypothetical protein
VLAPFLETAAVAARAPTAKVIAAAEPTYEADGRSSVLDYAAAHHALAPLTAPPQVLYHLPLSPHRPVLVRVGVASGSGIPGRWIERVIGVVKAYSTRVGGGPLPTEQENAIGMHLRERGREYGTVTKRPRRCGWFDAVAARYTARLSGVDELAVMLLDVLGGLDELKICSAYEIAGERTTQFPSQLADLERAVPVYETLPGWRSDISGVRAWGDLPAAARDYVQRIEDLVGIKVKEQLIDLVENFFGACIGSINLVQHDHSRQVCS